MNNKESWDWSTDLKEIPIKEWEDKFNWVQSPIVSLDGESVAAIVNMDEMAFSVCVNGSVWEDEYEKIWNLTPVSGTGADIGSGSKSGTGFAAFAAKDDEWTVAVNGESWKSRCDFIWNMMLSADGKTIGAAFQSDSEYGVIVNDVPWEERYENMTDAVLGPDGSSAAVVQLDSMAAADVDAFKQGLFAVALNGKVKDRKFLNIWDISFDSTGKNIAYGVRLDREKYAVVQNSSIWANRFQSVWKPVFLDTDNLLAPVRINEKWYLYKNDVPFWTSSYNQLWHVAVSQSGRNVAAIVSKPFGKWSVAVNDQMWNTSWDDMVTDIHFSKDGTCIAAVCKHNRIYWDLVVDQYSWQLAADQIFFPQMNYDGSVVAVTIKKQGKYELVVNGRTVEAGFDFMADPVVSPVVSSDGSKVILKGIKDGIYKRQIISV